MSFPCFKCGECCRHIGEIPELSEFDRGDGSCVHLVGNICNIYESRPEICRVDVMYDRYFSEMMPKEEFYKMNLEVCRQLNVKTY